MPPYQISRNGIGGQGIQHVSRTDLQGLTSWGGGTEEREQQVPHIPRRLHQFGTSTIQANWPVEKEVETVDDTVMISPL